MDFVGNTDASPQLRQVVHGSEGPLRGKLSAVRKSRPPIFAFTLNGKRYDVPGYPGMVKEVVLLHVLEGIDCTVTELAELILERYQAHDPNTTVTLKVCTNQVNAAINDLNNTP